MSNHITIELCEADRARLDRLIKIGAELIDRLPARVNITEPLPSDMIRIIEGDDTRESDDTIQQKLRQIVKKGTEAPQEATEEATPTEDTTPQEETPTEAKDEPAPTVTLEQIQQKVVQLCATDGGKKKAMVREIINLYGTKVSDLKERPDKWDEVMGLLTALEKEATA